MRILVALLFIVAPLFAQVADPELGIIKQWQGYPKGMDTKNASHLIDDAEEVDAQNVLFDEEACAVMRGGTLNAYSTLMSSGSVRLAKVFTTAAGKSYVVAVASATLAYASTDLNDRNWHVLVSTIPLNTTVWAAQFANRMFIGTYDGDRWSLDSNLNLVISTTVPQLRDCISYYDKLLGCNVNADAGHSQIAYCAVGDYMNWRYSDILNVERDDGDEMKAVRNFNGKLYGFKGRSTYLLTNFDDDFYSNDAQERILSGIGCKYKETLCEKGNTLFFVSDRGVESFDGSGVGPIPLSRKVDGGIQGFTQMKEVIAAWEETTQADFDGFTSRYNVLATTYGIVQAKTDFSTGVVLGLSGPTIKGYAYAGHVPIICYRESGGNILIASYTYTIGWSTGMYLSKQVYGNINNADMAVDKLANIGVSYVDGGGTAVIFSSWTGLQTSTKAVDASASTLTTSFRYSSANVPVVAAMTSNDLKVYTYSAGTFTGTKLLQSGISDFHLSGKLGMALDSSDTPYIGYESRPSPSVVDVYVSSRTGVVFSSSIVLRSTLAIYPDYTAAIAIDIDAANMPHVASSVGSGPSDVYYSSWTPNGWKTTHVHSGADGNQIGIKLASGIPYIAFTENSTGKLIISSPTPLGGFTTTYCSEGIAANTPSIAILDNNSVTVAQNRVSPADIEIVNARDGSYVSKVYNATTNDLIWTYWTSLTADTQNNGMIRFYTRTGTSPADTLTKDWVASSTGTLIPSSNGSYAQYRILFSSPVTSNIVSDIQLHYAIDQRLKPICCTVKDSRLWVSGATYPSLFNDTVYVYDINNNWTRFKGIYAASFYEFGNELFFGDATQGKVHKYSTDYTTDNGAAIDTYIRTKDFDMGTYSYDKSLDSLWFYTSPSVVYSSVTVEYFVDKSTTANYSHPFSLASLPNYSLRPITYKISADDSRWRYIGIKFSNFQKLYGYIVKYLKHGESER